MVSKLHPHDKAFLDTAATHALSFQVTLYYSFLLAEKCIEEGIPGCFVECGVFAGAQVAAMGHALKKHKDPRKIHLFDSFCGIPQSGPNDDESITALIGVGDDTLRTTGISACSEPEVRSNMRSWGIDQAGLVFHPGWFQDTVPTSDTGPIALLRLDGDLYSSTKVCLDHLYPRLSPGGIIIIDDYALTGCRKAVHDCLNPCPELTAIEGGGGPVYGQKPR